MQDGLFVWLCACSALMPYFRTLARTCGWWWQVHGQAVHPFERPTLTNQEQPTTSWIGEKAESGSYTTLSSTVVQRTKKGPCGPFLEELPVHCSTGAWLSP